MIDRVMPPSPPLKNLSGIIPKWYSLMLTKLPDLGKSKPVDADNKENDLAVHERVSVRPECPSLFEELWELLTASGEKPDFGGHASVLPTSE